MNKIYKDLAKRAGYIKLSSRELEKYILKSDMEGIECRLINLEDDIRIARELFEKLKEEGEEDEKERIR